MIAELVHTSVARGLRPGSQGYCTVACTRGMAANHIELCEDLSHYAASYPVKDPRYLSSPVAYSYHRLRAGDSDLAVLSRIACCPPDYTGRTNYLAHHVVLDLGDDEAAAPGTVWPPAAGPAELMRFSSPPLFLRVWGKGDEPRYLDPRPGLPPVAPPPPEAPTWGALAGDPGWAGALAQHSLRPGAPPVCVVYDPERLPDSERLLDLVAEAMAFLPPRRRWQVTFHTYFQRGDPRCVCDWRFCVAGNRPAIEAVRRVRGHLLVDLTRETGPGPAPDSSLAQCAREGRNPVWEEPLPQPGAGSGGASRPDSGRGVSVSGPDGGAPIPLRPLQPVPSVRVGEALDAVLPGAVAPVRRAGADHVAVWAGVAGVLLLVGILGWWYYESYALAAALRAARVAPAEEASGSPALEADLQPAPAGSYPAPAPGGAALAEPSAPGQAPAAGEPAVPAAEAPAPAPEPAPPEPAAPPVITVLPEPLSRNGISLQAAARGGVPFAEGETFWDCSLELVGGGRRVEPRLGGEVRQGGHPLGQVGDHPCRLPAGVSPFGLRVFANAIDVSGGLPVDALGLSLPGRGQSLLLLDTLRVPGAVAKAVLDLGDGWRSRQAVSAGGRQGAAFSFFAAGLPPVMADLGPGLLRAGFSQRQAEAIRDRACLPDMEWAMRLHLTPGEAARALGLAVVWQDPELAVAVAVRPEGSLGLAFTLRQDTGARAARAGEPVAASGLEAALAACAQRLLAEAARLPPAQVGEAFGRVTYKAGEATAGLRKRVGRLNELERQLGQRRPDPVRLENARKAMDEAAKQLRKELESRPGKTAQAAIDAISAIDRCLDALCGRLSVDEIERLRLEDLLQKAVDAELTYRKEEAAANRATGRDPAAVARVQEASAALEASLAGKMRDRVLTGRAPPPEEVVSMVRSLREAALRVAEASGRHDNLTPARLYLVAAAEFRQEELTRQYYQSREDVVRGWAPALEEAVFEALGRGAWLQARIEEVTGRRVSRGGEQARPFLRLTPAETSSP